MRGARVCHGDSFLQRTRCGHLLVTFQKCSVCVYKHIRIPCVYPSHFFYFKKNRYISLFFKQTPCPARSPIQGLNHDPEITT